ncbi:D-alanyl-D-alanine carboxypeptidase/D-alanyl-D-alanine-endopeptidase [Sphaerotilus mobilis]|uniref:D-alanyl-D-alanine carboxypeptidase/D-alanyl-D-alanine-endopeptidase (Penicillin-binding protein 4) n=1 Tax=Sphaerotilus mobilis TaxID=47994 RepID=A0A4Q7LB11_9BURK|nr:D-alanyl-D-alanine carboxypeptidase/D-alanyl-D-alanine-endopeptidase [Sphaerotilus mobilis]RZS46830.1 D-alanyl-D-alanine carboxypeptidase/D-alanyl-D-alanine-endopeptidase (penicillin-binding protein 4) [Sphaerotilus mobilis]
MHPTRRPSFTLPWTLQAMALMAAMLPSPAPAQATQRVPQRITAALAQAGLPAEAMHVWIGPVDGGEPWLAHRAGQLVNPASLMKLLTSASALETLGRSHQWQTLVSVDALPREGVLTGSLRIRGGGDPSLVAERLWLLLDQIRQRGVREIRGDIVLDRSAYAIPEVDPAAFDNEPLKPYNARPDALLVNFKSLTLTFRPQPSQAWAEVSVDLPLAGWRVSERVPLLDGPCEDWRAKLLADFRSPTSWSFAGGLPRSCGERSWSVAYNEPATHAARAIEAQWRALGGALQGKVRNGGSGGEALPLFTFSSPPLADVLRPMNLYSNNTIAQQMLLALGGPPNLPLPPGASPAPTLAAATATWDAGRAVVTGLLPRVGCTADELKLDNGSGLSRDERITPRCLAQWLRWSWRQPWMPDLVSSLPLAGEATARRATSVAGRAHLKTGSLSDVAGVAGYLDGADGRRAVVVVILNHPLASREGGRAVIDAVLGWGAERLGGALR